MGRIRAIVRADQRILFRSAQARPMPLSLRYIHEVVGLKQTKAGAVLHASSLEACTCSTCSVSGQCVSAQLILFGIALFGFPAFQMSNVPRPDVCFAVLDSNYVVSNQPRIHMQ